MALSQEAGGCVGAFGQQRALPPRRVSSWLLRHSHVPLEAQRSPSWKNRKSIKILETGMRVARARARACYGAAERRSGVSKISERGSPLIFGPATPTHALCASP